MTQRNFLVALLAFAMAAPTVVLANVSLKNGNFFIGYTDIVYPGGFEPKIERIYNSKTPFKGMFGWGWGNEYETHLKVTADGSVVVHEYGGGADNRFTPIGLKGNELAKAIDTIAAAARKAGSIGTTQQLERYKQKLKSDAVYRNDEWERYRRAGLVKARELPANTKLISTRFSTQYIAKLPRGYVRVMETGKAEHFDDEGRMIKVVDKNSNFVQLSRRNDGKIEKIIDNFNRKIFVSYNSKGLVEKVQGEGGKQSTYAYNALDELVTSKDVEGNVYKYSYSSDKRHNLVQVGYSDKTTLEIAYYGMDKNESVKSVKDRDGGLTEYSYWINPKDKGHTTVQVAVKSSSGKPVSTSKYEYFIRSKSNGERWTEKMVTTLDGEVTETSYHPTFGLPATIKRGGELTAFTYDNRGRVAKKVTPYETTVLAYDAKAGKVSRVERKPKSGVGASWSEFKYDPKGNLVFARNSDKKTVQLVYDLNGRIKTMVDQGKRRIDFKYNENSKPVEIVDSKAGSITVSYANTGEIKGVESSAGRKVATEVTSAFQNLLDIIRPAGVSLSF